MRTADKPEYFREAWHNEIEQFERLKQTLDVDRWDELDEATEQLRELVNDAAEEFEE